MEFLDKIGQKASEAYKATADKTGKIAKETKLRLKMGELKSQVNDLYTEIGKKVYEKHTSNEDICIKKDLEEECTKIDVLSEEIESILKECLELKDKKVCYKCFKEIDKQTKFCPECGAKQEEIVEEPAREVEVVKNENLEKTVEVEADVNLKEDETTEEIKSDEE